MAARAAVATVVGAGLAIAAAARTRERLATERLRFDLLRGAAQISDGETTVPQVVDRVRDLIVPALADACTIEVVHHGRTERLAEAPATLRARSRMVVPLYSRGHQIGTLELVSEHRDYSAEDRGFATLIGGRIALALHNAGLFAELQSLQERLTTALGTLAEAVTIQDDRGNLVYANDAAAAALGFASADQLLATPPRQIVDAYDSFYEDGSPLRLEDLPGRQVLAGRTPAPLVVRAIHRASGEERWRIVKATGVPVRPGQSRLAVNVIEDVTEVKRAELAQRFLAQAGAVLASSLDYERTLAGITELAVPRLADWCAVSLPGDGNRLPTVAVAHTDPEKVEFARAYQERYPTSLSDPTGAAQVLREGRSQVINDIPDALLEASIPDPERLAALRTIGMRAAMIVPMVAAGRAIGVISFVSAESQRTFAPADLELAEELGRRAGTAVEHARLYRERSHIAATLQRGLLPDELPVIPGVRLASLYRPAGAENLVGGDFYDAFRTPAGWMLLVGDVTGRGPDAAAQTGQARHTLRTAGTLLGAATGAFEQLNQALADREELTPCTVALVQLEDHAATVFCAGHPLPLLIREGAVRSIGRPGPMLGAWTDSVWPHDRVELRAGDVLVLYTDGVTDTRGAAERFGHDRLIATLRDVTGAAAAVAAIDHALSDFQHGAQADDTAVLAVEVD
jgi:PAS domain S-box-containing protein